MRPAFFFDRDGTLNEERGYIHRWDQFRWRTGVQSAIKELNAAGILVVVVTNQGGIAHGYYSEEHVVALHARMSADLGRYHAWIDAYYYCPHHPLGAVARYRSECQCRKPNPGLIHRAARDLGIDLASSAMFGDRPSDLQAGKDAGIPTLRMVNRSDDLYTLVSPLVDLYTLVSPLVRSRTPRSGSPRNPLQPAA